jgi:hypothetical protein
MVLAKDEYWTSTSVHERRSEWLARALFPPPSRRVGPSAKGIVAGPGPVPQGKCCISTVAHTLVACIHNVLVVFSVSRWYEVVLTVFLALSFWLSSQRESDTLVLVAMLAGSCIFFAAECTRLDRRMLFRLLHHHEYVFLLVTSVLQLVFRELTFIHQVQNISPSESLYHLAKFGVIFGLPFQFMANLCIISLDARVTTSRRAKVALPMLSAISLIFIIIGDRNNPPRDPPKLCLWYCTDTAEIGSSLLVYNLLFAFKYSIMAAMRPHLLLVVHATTTYKSVATSAGGTVTNDELTIAQQRYANRQNERLKRAAIKSAYYAEHLGEPWSVSESKSDSSSDSDSEREREREREPESEFAESRDESDSKLTAPKLNVHSNQETDLMQTAACGSPATVLTVSIRESDTPPRRRISTFVRRDLPSQLMVVTGPVSSGTPPYLGRPVLNVKWLIALTRYKYYAHTVVSAILLAIGISATQGGGLPRPVLLACAIVAVLLFLCEVTRCDMFLFKRLLSHFEWYLLLGAVVVFVAGSQIELIYAPKHLISDSARWTYMFYSLPVSPLL